MGYTTEFEGEFSITPKLMPTHRLYLQKFADARHVQRDVNVLEALPDPLRESVGLPLGLEGEFYVGNEKVGIIDIDRSPNTVPGLWCGWDPNCDGTKLVWDGAEKFYSYVEWLEYIIEKFLKPWGYVLNGDVDYCGESAGDRGIIRVRNNIVNPMHSV